MKRLLKWLLPVLIVCEIGLVRLKILDLKEAVFIVVGAEVLLLVVGGTQIRSAVREYRRNRAAGFDGWKALEGGVDVLLPRLAARLIVSELRLFYCLLRWVLRRTRLREGEFSYHKRSTLDMFVLMIVLVSPVEVLVIELLLQAFLPLLWLRILVLFLEVYAVFWIVGFYASRIVLPHRLEETGLRLHHGIFVEGFIPYVDIESVERARQKAPEWGDGLQRMGDEAYLAIGGNTDIALKLHSRRALQGFIRLAEPMSTVHLAIDDPKRFARELDNRLNSRVSVSSARSIRDSLC
ncbi:MAG: hypothetical protein WA982_13650 [Rubrobacteraceae bacterium]